MTQIEWILKQHRDKNQMYDKYLPYEFHLRMVNGVKDDFIHLIPKQTFVQNSYNIPIDVTLSVLKCAAYGHDLIEDTGVSYNDVVKVLGVDTTEIIRAVTNDQRGRNRKERMPDYIYEEIRETPGATFIKLCDRIANVQYGKMSKSSMFHMYQQENDEFLEKVGANKYPEMKEYLTQLLNNDNRI